MSKLKTYQQQVQDIIEKSINTVEEQHKSLAVRPFELAEKLEKEAKSYSIKSIRSKHNSAATSAYDALRVWNKRLGEYAGDLLGRFDKEADQAADAVTDAATKAKKPVAKKASSARKTVAKKAESVQASV
ncbi:MAG: hypothetical protein EA349_12180 [Halomonadaceae bacterium]|nr:MAG: hypothetical protein EA349_12180 [Halomonadaceae bacterium]